MESAGEILERVCPCGGDPTGPQHQESLLHRQWMLGQGVCNGHDPLEDQDRRGVWTVVPVPDWHDLR